MKPRRPTIKDSTQTKNREAIARKAAQIAARAKRKAAAKKAKLEAEPHEDFSQAAARIVREATER